MQIRFLGAAGTVTGSRALLRTGDVTALVDCGLFQGFKSLRERNWAPFPFDPAALDAVVLTHAHLDHSGALPLLRRAGFRGPVHCTAATADLVALLLPDSGYLQEEDARYANRKGFSKHRPALPLYTREEAERCLDLLRPVPFGVDLPLAGPLSLRLQPAGHILGAASALLRDDAVSVLFSGDLGRSKDLLLAPPEPPPAADALVLESTYGDRLHAEGEPLDALAEVINRALGRGGEVLIPTFAVGRAQTLLVALHRLIQRQRIPAVPVLLNSPMAVHATAIADRFSGLLRVDPAELRAASAGVRLVSTEEDSRQVTRERGPRIVLSASGMLAGGRVLHHLRAIAYDPRSTVLFVGFQAPGTRGEALLRGSRALKMHGELVDVRCEIAQIEAFSAHADQEELMRWLRSARPAPGRVLLNHGEPAASEALRLRIQGELHLPVSTVAHGDAVEIAAAGAPRPVAAAPSGVAAILKSPTYLRADQDLELLNADALRPTRLSLEFLKADLALRAAGISDTVVVFGGTRVIEAAAAAERLALAEQAWQAAPADPATRRARAVAERVLARARYYEEARAFGRLASTESLDGRRRLVVVTGGGPGIMEAANRGAFEAGAPSIGLNITLPHEQAPNPYITPSLCFQFRYFALRKMHFMMRAQALVAFPGGYGTLDELYDALCLIQTGKTSRMPVVLVGKGFWERVFDPTFLAEEGLISEEDAELVTLVDTGEAAWRAIQAFYAQRAQAEVTSFPGRVPGDPRRCN